MNLETYTARIGYAGDLKPDPETLKGLHLAHATHIPFENLDVLLRRPVPLDLDSLWAKLVCGGRGGYCFEQNALFAAVLEQIGFRVTRLAARVRAGATGIRPRSHMLLLVDGCIADVGFGAEGLLLPVPLRPGEEARHFGWTYRVVTEGPLHVLQSLHPEGWFDLYSFTLEEQYPVDYEVSNHFTSTYPRSPFVRTLLVQRPGIERRLMLVNRRLIETTPQGQSETVLADDDALLEVLSSRFGLNFPPGTRFPYEES